MAKTIGTGVTVTRRKTKMKNLILIIALALLIPTAAAAQGNAFSFQGRLNDGTTPANGSYDLQFTLYTAIVGGSPIGSTIPKPNTTLVNGVFSVMLDFGATAFSDPNAVFIEIGIKPNGSPNAFTILGPRQQLTVVPYAVRSGSSAVSDNSTSLNGLNSSEFIRNSTPGPDQSFAVYSGKISSSLFVGSFFNPDPNIQLEVMGNVRFKDTNGRSLSFGNPNAETGISFYNGFNRADLRMDGIGTIKLLNSAGAGIPADSNGISLDRFGRVGIGTVTPATRFSLVGGAQWSSNNWTASMDLQNFSAIGWQPNSSGNRFGIGQNVNGLQFFRTQSLLDDNNLPAHNDMTITNTGNITQPPGKYGLVKAMVFITSDGNIGQCYNALFNSVTGTCGFVVTKVSTGDYTIDLNQPAGRFFSATPEHAYHKIGARLTAQNVISVGLTHMIVLEGPDYYNTDVPVDGGFTLIVY